MDAKSFYNNIPNLKEIAAAKRALDKNSNKTATMKAITTF